MFQLMRQILASVHKRGLARTVAFSKSELIRKYRQYRSFDRIHGTDTAGFTPLNDLSIASENRDHGIQYQPTPAKLFTKIIRHLPVRHEDYVFVDFGSGKGRVLLLASSHPFKRVIGVEFSPELHATALRNIAHYQSSKQRCFEIEAVCMDVVDYTIPPQPAIYYFFNPFDDVIMRTVLTNIKESLESHPRDAFFIYFNPVQAHLFDEFAFQKNRTILVEGGIWGHL
jgi:16S rRNA G966 N2-methylase RsmD